MLHVNQAVYNRWTGLVDWTRTDVFGYTSVEELYLMSWGGGGILMKSLRVGNLPSLQGIKVIL